MATNFSGFLTFISFAVVADGIAIAIPLVRRLLPLLLGCCLATSTRTLTFTGHGYSRKVYNWDAEFILIPFMPGLGPELRT